MPTPIRIKRSSVSGKRPGTSQLDLGELAINFYDGSLFIKRDTGGVGIGTTVVNITPWQEKFNSTDISYTGNVGVGTDNITAKLDVAGTTKTQQLNVSDVSTFTGNIDANGDLDVDGHTELDQLRVSGVSTFQGNINLGDNDQIIIGDGSDLKLYHDGVNSYVQESGTGALRLVGDQVAIRNNAENMAVFNTNADVKLYYDNSKKFETTNTGAKVTGDLEVTGVVSYDDVTNVDSIGIITARSGIHVGVGLSVAGISTFQGDVRITDDDKLRFGTSGGGILQIYTNGTNSFFKQTSGNLKVNAGTFHINNGADNESMALFTSNGSVALFHDNSKKFETTGYGVTIFGTTQTQQLNVTGVSTFQNHVHLGDDDELRFGANNDFKIYHDPNDARIENSNGDIKFKNTGSYFFFDEDGGETLASFINDGAANLFYGGSKKFETTASGINVTGHTETDTLNVSGVSTFQGNVNLGDNDQIIIGDGSDLKLYHDGSNSYVEDTGVGALIMKGSTIRFRSTTNENIISASQNGSVDLYYDNSKKFETTSSGIDVTGLTDTDTLNVSGVSTFQSDVHLGDNDAIKFGANNDLHIYSVGGQTRISQENGGLLNIRNKVPDQDVVIQTDNGNGGGNITNYFRADGSTGEVKLYHYGAQKFATTSTGAKVTGDLEVTGVLSYDDVTNIDSVGIVTARSGIHVTGGNVGVGTNNPNRKLVVEGSGNTFSSIKAGTSDDVGLLFGDTDSDARGLVRYSNTNDALSLWTAGTERLRITSSGKVGINESSNINGRLHIQHDTLNENILYATRYNDQSNDKPIFAVTEATMSGMSSPGLVIGNHNRDIHIGQVFDDAAGLYSSDTTGIRITSAGRVGVGTVPNTNVTLDIKGAGASVIRLNSNNFNSYTDLRHNQTGKYFEITPSSTSSQSFIVNKPNGDEALRITSGGNIGIGTNNPQAFLHLETPAATGGWQIRTDSYGLNNESGFFRDASDHYECVLRNGAGGLAFIKNNGGASDPNLHFHVGTTEKMRITSDGNVGIGTNNPQEKLHVLGTSDFVVDTDTSVLRFGSYGEHDIALVTGRNTPDGSSRLYIENGNGEALRITSGGQVSIAADLTQSTDAKLTVEGSAASTNLDQTLVVRDSNTNDAIGNGGFIGLAGFAGNVPRTFAGIRGLKSSSGNSFNGDLAFYTRQNAVANLDEKLRITSDGKVGIGTDNPTALLHAQNNSVSDTKIIIESTGTNSYPALRIINDARSYDLGIDGATDALRFYDVTGSTERLRITSDGKVRVPDNGKFVAGDGDDLQIYHDGSNSYISDQGSGSLRILTNQFRINNVPNSGTSAIFNVNGSVDLHYNGAKKFETGQFGVTVTGSLAASNIDMVDNAKLLLGTGDDLQIFHDGSNNYIQGISGNLILKNNNSDYFVGNNSSGSVELNYNGSKKFETTNTGAKVTGNLEVTGVLTYDDVTNIDSVGIVTAQSGIDITSGNLTIPDKIVHLGDNNTAIRFPTNDTIRFVTSGSSRFDVSPNGYILLGTTSEPSGGDAHAQNAKLLIQGRIGNTSDSGRLNLQRGSAASNNSSIGSISFTDNSNNAYARIETLGDDATGSNDYPGRIVFSTTNDGASTPTEKLRITSGGKVNVNQSSGTVGSRFNIFNGSDTFNIFGITGADESSEYAAIGVIGGNAIFTGGGSGTTSTGIVFRTANGGAETEKVRITSDGDITTSGSITTQTYPFYENNRRVLEVNGGTTQGWLALGATRTDTDAYVGGINFINRHGQADAHRFLGYIRLKSTHVNTGQYGTGVLKGQLEFATKSSSAGISTTTPDMVISHTGLVGIGTANPGSLLTLDHATNPAIQLRDSGTKVASINAEGTQTNIASFEGKDLVFAASSSSAFTERLRITADGTIQLSNLSSTYTSGTATRFSLFNDTNNHYGLHVGGSFDLNYNAGGSVVGGKGEHVFHTAAQERVRITSSGRLGVGIANPNSNLHVKGGSESTDNLLLTLQSNGVANDGSLSTGLRLINSTSDTSIHGADIRAIRTGSASADLTFSLYYGSNPPTERLRITAAGKVGINNSSPERTLDITSDATAGTIRITGARTFTGNNAFFTGRCSRGTIASPATLVANDIIATFNSLAHDGSNYLSAGRIRFGVDSISTGNLNSHLQFIVSNNGEYEALRITAAGNVGIGTDNPDTLLNLFGTGNTTIKVHNNSATAGTYSRLQLLTGGVGSSAKSEIRSLRMSAASAATNLVFFTTLAGDTSPTERVRITAAGNVGIGINNPNALLHLQNDSVSDTKIIIESTGTNSYPALRLKNDVRTYDLGIDGATDALRFYDVTGSTERLRITSSGNISIKNDSGRFTAGTSDDLQIYHNGNHSVITNTGTGNLSIQNNGGEIQLAKGGTFEHMIRAVVDGQVELYNDGNKKLETTSTGIIVTGALSKSSGSFRIDHPVVGMSTTHDLVHSFIEGPQADLIYRGKVDLIDGSATVNIDTAGRMTEGTFVALCTNVQCFTSNETDWTAVKGSVSGNILTILAQDSSCTATISWMVVGERKDQHMIDTDWTDDSGRIITEPLKVGIGTTV